MHGTTNPKVNKSILSEYSHHMKDLVLVTLLLTALIGCWYAYRQNKNSRRHLRRMMKDMESLHKAELALEQLQVRHVSASDCRKKN